DLDEDAIAGLVAAAVVDRLEAVDVDEEDGDAAVDTGVAQGVVEGAVMPQARERVARGALAELGYRLGGAQAGRGVRDEQLEELDLVGGGHARAGVGDDEDPSRVVLAPELQRDDGLDALLAQPAHAVGHAALRL